MRIGILGTPVNSGNRGVSALGASLLNLCWEPSGGGEAMLMGLNKDNCPAEFRVGGKLRRIEVVNARMSPRSRFCDHFAVILITAVAYRLLPIQSVRRAFIRWVPWVRALSEAAWVGDVRGGDSFSDIYGIRRYIVGFLTAWTVLLINKKLVQFPQTYGPYSSSLARWMAGYLLQCSSIVLARDRVSQRIAQGLAGRSNQVLLSPDVAFSLEVRRPAIVELDSEGIRTPQAGAIGVNVNGLMYHGGYSRDNAFGLRLSYPEFLQKLIEELLARTPGEIWLIPHTFAPAGHVESDPDASRNLREGLKPELKARVKIVTAEYDHHEIKGVIGMCDFFVGSRMHSCIAALSQGIPCVGVAYSMKFAGVFEAVGMETWVVDGRELSNEEAIARVIELYAQRDQVREALMHKAEEARARLTEVFQQIFAEASRR